MSMMLEATQFRITRGQTTSFDISGDNGTLKRNCFCAACATMIYGWVPARPATLYLRPGTLDDTDKVTAQAHIYLKSKQPWVTVPADVPCFEELYDPRDVWPEESLARLARLCD